VLALAAGGGNSCSCSAGARPLCILVVRLVVPRFLPLVCCGAKENAAQGVTRAARFSVHLANPTSVTRSACRDNDDCAPCASGWSWRGSGYISTAREPREVCHGGAAVIGGWAAGAAGAA
jgi:hypothetical protein